VAVETSHAPVSIARIQGMLLLAKPYRKPQLARMLRMALGS
jgi:hypothetical protein